MICLELFLTFLEIGAVSFGGGYGMISLIRELTIAKGWLSEAELMNFIAVSESTPGPIAEAELMNFIAVSESTPGPIAVNMATFVGSSQAGAAGALCATLGVVLPSFVIILIIAALIRGILKYPAFQAVLGGVRPCVIGLIISTAVTMMLSVFFGITTVGGAITPEPVTIVIFILVAALALGYKMVRKKSLSPIILIVFSAFLGILLF